MKSRFSSFHSQGFTLAEILTVMTILVILGAATVPTLKGTLDGVNLSGAVEVAQTQFSLARQTAITRNIPVEVRIYQTDDGTGLDYRTMAAVIPALVSNQPADEWLLTAKTFPGHVVIDSTAGQEFSTVITESGSQAPSTADPALPGPWSATESTGAPDLVKGKNYVAFRFQPDGTTNLPKDKPWCLSFKGQHDHAAGSSTAPAANYASIVLDPLTGRTLVYRP